MIPFMEKLAQTNDIYSILKQGSIVESNNNQEVSSFLQTRQLNADYNQTANKIEKTVLLNKKTSSSFNKIDFITNKNDNLNEDEYSIVHENSIIVSVDNSSQKS
jgi:biopolymer transport protein ExbB/TolQ